MLHLFIVNLSIFNETTNANAINEESPTNQEDFFDETSGDVLNQKYEFETNLPGKPILNGGLIKSNSLFS